MKAIGLMLLAASTAHGFMVSPIVRPLHPVKIASATSMIDAPSGPSLDFFINQVSAFFAGGSKEPLPPTADEIAEYCRDPDSTGCDLDMVDALMAEADKLKKVQKKGDEPVRWSKDIDDAVFKCD